MTNADDPTHQYPPRPTLTIAAGALNRTAGLVILLLAIGSITTQAIAVATGRDFLFGLIPKLNPAGPRSIPFWLASAALATWGTAALLAGAALGRARGKSAASWWWLAGAIVLLSADRSPHWRPS